MFGDQFSTDHMGILIQESRDLDQGLAFPRASPPPPQLHGEVVRMLQSGVRADFFTFQHLSFLNYNMGDNCTYFIRLLQRLNEIIF